MSVSKKSGIVYVLTNPAMPGLVKIGKTAGKPIIFRLKELYKTGVPVPFECAYAARVADENEVERRFHRAFKPNRINQKREFFQIEPEQAIGLLELLAIEDVTPEVQRTANRVDKQAEAGAKKLKPRRPNLNFLQMGIPVGAQLVFTQTSDTVEVLDDRRVQFKKQSYSLTAITRKLLGKSHDVAPSPFWTYNGRSLHEIYDEIYE